MDDILDGMTEFERIQFLRKGVRMIAKKPLGADPSKWSAKEREERGIFEYTFPDGHQGWAHRHCNLDKDSWPADEFGGIVEYPTAIVGSSVYMEPETCVYNHAMVLEGVLLKDGAQVSEHAILRGGQRSVSETNFEIEKNILIVQGDARIRGDTHIQHLDNAFLNASSQREVLDRIRRHIVPTEFGILIEGGVFEGWNEIAGIELRIGPQISMTDSLLLGRNISLTGEKNFVKKNIQNGYEKISAFEEYDPLQFYSRIVRSYATAKIPENPETPEEQFLALTIPKIRRYLQREEQRPGTRAFKKKGFHSIDGGKILRGPHGEKNSAGLSLIHSADSKKTRE